MFLEFWEIVLAMALAVGWAMFAEAKKAEINKLKSQILSLQESNLHWRNEAAKGCRVRASNGDHQAMLALGMIYLDGVDSQMTARKRANEGDEPDYWSALDWFQRAADCGNPEAMFRLGYMHHQGIMPDLRKNPIKAIDWYKRAAGAGHSEAHDWLSRLEREIGHEVQETNT